MTRCKFTDRERKSEEEEWSERRTRGTFSPSLDADITMVGDESQQQLLPNAAAQETATEDSPLTDVPPDGEDEAVAAMPEVVEWSTSMLSQVRDTHENERMHDILA